MIYAIAEFLDAVAFWLRQRDPFIRQINDAYIKVSSDGRMRYLISDIPTRRRIERLSTDHIRLVPSDIPNTFDVQFRTDIGVVLTLVIDPNVRGYTFMAVRP